VRHAPRARHASLIVAPVYNARCLHGRAASSVASPPPPASGGAAVATSLTSFSDPVYDLMSQVSPFSASARWSSVACYPIHNSMSFTAWREDWSPEQPALLQPCHAFTYARPVHRVASNVTTC